MNITEHFKKDLTRLHNQGVNLINAMQVEQFPAEMEAHFTNVLKKDFAAFRQGLPSFNSTYQAWYSEAQLVISQYLPGRLSDFNSLYEPQKGRKEIRKDNYNIEDYLRATTVTAGFDKKVTVGPADAIPLLQQQLNILDAIGVRLDSHITDTNALLQASLLDETLNSASELLKNGFARSAGALCGVIISQHFEQVRQAHQLKATRKTMALKDYNELFSKAEIYEFGVYRQVQYLAEMRDLCVKNKKTAPSAEQIEDMISGTHKIIKTVF
jgi:hypothetical protein